MAVERDELDELGLTGHYEPVVVEREDPGELARFFAEEFVALLDEWARLRRMRHLYRMRRR